MAGGTVFVLTARLRDDAEMFERGIQEFASFNFLHEGFKQRFYLKPPCMFLFQTNLKPDGS